MGQSASCFRGSECVVDVDRAPTHVQKGPKTTASCDGEAKQQLHAHACAAEQQQAAATAERQQQCGSGTDDQQRATPAADRKLDPSLACCLGAALQPNGVYDVSTSGPPLPGCEPDRLEQSHLGEMLDFAPKEELQNILALVCNMFSVENALVSLFFDRRVYIIDGTGVFTEGDFPWRYSLCGWTMASEQDCVMIINDITQDTRFCNNPVAKKYGVRFYVGAPLVSSSGHRIGTLCFADSKPRIFDDSSLKLLCNFSELVTRALERDIVVAHHKQVTKPGEALKELEHKHRYRMLLRSIDCVSSAVLLVDTGTPGWVVRYTNSGWQTMVQRCMQSQATRDWVNAASSPAADQSSSQLASEDGTSSTATASTTVRRNGMPRNGSGRDIAGNNIVGMLLWPMVEEQLSRDPDHGSSIMQQLQQLLSTRQPFTLHGLELPGLQGVTASFVFRSAGVSDIEGAVGICMPSWVPQPASVPAAAAALQSTAADQAAPNTTCPPWQTLYFVSVIVESPQDRQSRQMPGLLASTTGSFSVGQGRRGGSSGSKDVVSAGGSSSGISLSVPTAGQAPNGAARCVYDDSNLVVLSSLSQHSYNISSNGSNSSNVQAESSCNNNTNSGSNTASLVGSCFTSITASSAAAAARAVCRKIEGLNVGGLIASGSYGRVYRGDYYGSTVAVKVLESDSVLRREAMTGLCLEALLGEKFKHPNIIRTLAWAVVTGKSKMDVGRRLWGETLDVGKPTIADNKAAITAGGAAGKQLQRVASDASSGRDSTDQILSVSQQLPSLNEEDMCDSNSSLNMAETWLILEYCNKGCLQDAIDRGWLRDGPGGPVSLFKVVVTAAEVAAGMYTLHKADVVHADLSPYNVLLSSASPAAAEAGRGFVAKVSDFGLSRPLSGQSKLMTKTYGTLTHQSPEMLEHGMSSKAVDVYSFGVLLWQMLVSSRAWAGLTHHAVVHTVCVKKLQLQFPADAPEALADLGRACMSYKPEDRPTFKDILDVLLPLRDFVNQHLQVEEVDGVVGA